MALSDQRRIERPIEPDTAPLRLRPHRYAVDHLARPKDKPDDRHCQGARTASHRAQDNPGAWRGPMLVGYLPSDPKLENLAQLRMSATCKPCATYARSRRQACTKRGNHCLLYKKY